MLPSRLGFKLGVAQNIRETKEKEEKKADRIANLRDEQRKFLFTSFMTNRVEDKKVVAQRMSKIRQATLLGFSKDAATLLEASGELDLQLPRLKKLATEGKLNKKNVRKMSNLVMESLKDDSAKATAAINYLAQGNLNISNSSDFQDEFISAIFSADPDSVDRAATIYQKSSSRGGTPSFSGFTTEYNTRAYEAYENKEKQIDSLIKARILNLFGDGLELVSVGDGTVQYKGSASFAANKVTNDMKDIIKLRFNDPTVPGDYTDDIEIMATNLAVQTEGKLIDYDAIVTTTDPNFAVNYAPSNKNNEEDKDNNDLGGNQADFSKPDFNSIIDSRNLAVGGS